MRIETTATAHSGPSLSRDGTPEAQSHLSPHVESEKTEEVNKETKTG